MSTIIKNAKIIDGINQEPFEGSILIENGKIARIIPAASTQNQHTGDLINEIDVSGLIVAPGFIDAHAHDDFFPLINPSVYYKLEQGVTTSVSGNCGVSLFPLNDSSVKEFAAMAARSPDSNKIMESLKNFKDFEHFREAINNNSALGPNLVFLIGHGTIRMHVMGVENRVPTEFELIQMKELVETSMQQGAFGLSTGLIYPPGVFSTTHELIELCKVVAEYGGVYATHMRGESDTIIESVKEAIQIGRESGVRVQISHHKIAGKKNWGKSKETLKQMEEANEEGIDVKFDAYPYLAGKTGLSQIIPPQYFAGGNEEFVNRLKNKDNWDKIRNEIENPTSKWENFIQIVGYENLLLLQAPETPEVIGKTVLEYAEETGKDPLETAIEILIANNADCSMAAVFGSEDDLIRIMQHPLGMFSTDGMLEKEGGHPHPRSIGTYPRILGDYAREKGLLSLPTFINKMTNTPAKQFRIANKGAIKEGYDADLVIFDPQTIKDNNSFTAPHKKNSGIHYVFINGEVVVENNIYNGSLNGSILKMSQMKLI